MRVTLLTNPRAGRRVFRPGVERLREALASADVEADVRVVSGAELFHAAQETASARVDAVVAAGGDGTVRTVATALVDSGVALGIIPTGTLNHFARELGVPLEVQGAARVIAQRKVQSVDVGEINGHVFINNASIGLYPQIVQRRQEIEQRLGGSKWLATMIAAASVLRRYPLMGARIHGSGRWIDRLTPFIFVGNNQYDFSLTRLGRRCALNRGELCVYVGVRTGRFALLRMALRALVGRLEQSGDFESLAASELWILTPKRYVRVAIDGEVVRLTPPLYCRTRPLALKVLAPGLG